VFDIVVGPAFEAPVVVIVVLVVVGASALFVVAVLFVVSKLMGFDLH
jgi:hypothetical protein